MVWLSLLLLTVTAKYLPKFGIVPRFVTCTVTSREKDWLLCLGLTGLLRAEAPFMAGTGPRVRPDPVLEVGWRVEGPVALYRDPWSDGGRVKDVQELARN
ncbi:hypothetical protein TNCV_3687711 [Trichonephila clavipes]|nr:hypothetical protein TNCV_3687711 [Trichonephila clavipes]